MRRVNLFGALILTVLLLNCGAAPLVQVVARQHVPSADVVIYGDALGANWQDWSWDSAVNLAATTPVHSGTAAVAVDFTAAWAGFSLRITPTINPSAYESLHFWLYGGAGGANLALSIQPTDNGAAGSTFAVIAPAGVWTEWTVPLASLGDPTSIARITLMDASGTDQPTWYLDDLRLVARDLPPLENATVAIDLDGAPISFVPDHILGTNAAMWGRDALANPTFIARTRANGNGLVRIPGGASSQDYGAISCELGADLAGAFPCGEDWYATPSQFITFLLATERQAIYTLNINTTAQEAAALVAFFNGAVGDPRVIGLDLHGTDWHTVGYWAQLRATNGHAAPFHIRYWDFGNETYGGTQATGGAECAAFGWENVWTCNGGAYINGVGMDKNRHEGYLKFREAMRAVDPTIQLGAIGLADPAAFSNWSNELLAAGGATIDYYAIHPYSFDDVPANDAAGLATILARPQAQWPTIAADLQTAFATHADGRDIPLWVTEYNLTSVWEYDDDQLMTRAVNALFIADTIGQMIQHGAVVGNQWLLNGNTQANLSDYGLIRQDNARSPQYFAYPLWAKFGAQMLPTTNSADAATQLSVYGGRVNANTISLLAINKTAIGINTTFTLNDGGQPVVVTGGSADVVQAISLQDQTVLFNNVPDPNDDLSNAPSLPLGSSGTSPTYVLLPYSITLLRFETGAAVLQPSVFIPLVLK